jgi:hypothetical protein
MQLGLTSCTDALQIPQAAHPSNLSRTPAISWMQRSNKLMHALSAHDDHVESAPRSAAWQWMHWRIRVQCQQRQLQLAAASRVHHATAQQAASLMKQTTEGLQAQTCSTLHRRTCTKDLHYCLPELKELYPQPSPLGAWLHVKAAAMPACLHVGNQMRTCILAGMP